jgi:hypothetical protein
MTAIQKYLDLQDPRYTAVLCAIETAKALLSLNEDEIAALVDEGQLVAFDIRGPGANRRELRILTASIVHYRAHRSDPRYTSPITPEEAVAIVLSAVKHDKPFLRGREIKSLLNLGRQHCINLVSSKAIPQVPGTQYRRGPNGDPLVPRPQFINFLTHRLEGSI